MPVNIAPAPPPAAPHQFGLDQPFLQAPRPVVFQDQAQQMIAQLKNEIAGLKDENRILDARYKTLLYVNISILTDVL